MARPVVVDTSLLIHALRRHPRAGVLLARLIQARRIRFCSVVVGELYAGARSRSEAAALDRLAATARHDGLALVPSWDDWILANQLIARHVRLRGDLQPRDHLADALITVCAGRIGATVLTANLRHFDVWARLARAAGLDVTVTPFRPEV